MSIEKMKNPNGGNRQGFEVNENQPKGNVTMSNSVASNALTGKITIANTEMAIIEYKGQRVLTLAMIDQVHGRPEGTARKRFNDNREHFVLGEDFYELTASEIRMQSLNHVFSKFAPSGFVFSESGYLMLVKSFTDDLAWQVQRQLVKGYFKAKELLSNTLPSTYLDALKALVQTEEEKQLAITQVAQLETKVEELQPKANALDSLANATGLKTIQQTAKVLGVQPEKFLRPWMLENGWLHTAADGQYHAYAERIRAGHLKEKDRLITHKSGTQEIRVTVYVTPKGEALLAQRISNSPKAA